jgi:hypothetical protein
MKKFLTLGLVSLLAATPAFSAVYGDSAYGTVTRFVPRSSGNHTVFISSNTIPAQGCTLNDRAVIRGTDAGANTMVASLLLAISNGYQVSLRVYDCVLLNPDEDSVTTVPRVVKVGIQF